MGVEIYRSVAEARNHDQLVSSLSGQLENRIITDSSSIRAELCKRSMPYFMRTFWDVVTQDPMRWNWHLDEITTRLMAIAKRVGSGEPKAYDMIANVPPGTTKSLTVSVMFPVWCWINWYWMRFICASYSSDLSLEHAELSREIVRSRLFQSLFPDLRVKRDKDKKSNFKLEKLTDSGPVLGGNRFSTSVGGYVTGVHGHIIIVDDPIDPQGVDSDKERKTANRWMSHTLPSRKIHKVGTPTILIMQRLHEEDPTGFLKHSLKKTKLFHICLPGEIRDEEGSFDEKETKKSELVKPRRLLKFYKDGLLDPVRMPWEACEELLEKLGNYGYAAQILQSPAPPGGGLFKVENIEILDRAPRDEDIRMSVRYWDKAGTEKLKNPDAAWTCGTLISELKSSKMFVIEHVVRGQWGAETREKIIKNTAQMDRPKTFIHIEQEPGSGGKESVEASIRNLAGFIVYADKPTGAKEMRADPFSVQFNNGNVALVRGDWNRDFLDELMYFPNSRFKDQVDSSAGAFNMLVKSKETERII